MATYAGNYCGTGTTNASSNGMGRCKWKPRKLSAIRDFPDAFNIVTMNTKLSSDQPPVLVDGAKNISGSDHGVSQVAKRQKMSVVHESRNRTGANYEDNLGLVESVQGSSDTGVSDFIPLEIECESNESSDSTENFSSDYDVIPHMTTEHEDTDHIKFIDADEDTPSKKRKFSAIRCWPPGCGRKVIHLSDEEIEKEFTERKNHWLTCKNCRSEEEEEEVADNGKQNSDSDYDVIQHMTTEHEETEVTRYKERRISAVRCWPPGCGRELKHLSDEELQKELTEMKNFWLTCKNCNSGEEEEEEDEEGNEEAADNGKQSAAMFGVCTGLKFHGVSLKEMKCYQTHGELKIELSVANLDKDGFVVELSGKNEHTNTNEQPQLSRLVSVVRCSPPGCGN